MITLRPSSERGYADHGWLQSHHTFSFASYRDFDFMGFSNLRVLNQDRVAASQGFGTHGHQDMEIVSYVLDGVLAHKDSMGTGSELRPGMVQLMSAGKGVEHSEFNAADEELHFLQMWVIPTERGTEPRYDEQSFPESERRGALRLVVSPDGANGSLTIGADARLYAGLLDGAESAQLTLPKGRSAWLHVARGTLNFNGHTLAAGDGAAIQDESELRFTEGDAAEYILWELPSAAET